MPKWDLKFTGSGTYLLCEDCGWYGLVNQVDKGRGNLRELKAEHTPNCYPPNAASGGWCAPGDVLWSTHAL